MRRETPATGEEAAALLGDGARVRFTGGRTKLGWGSPPEADLELSTTGLDRIVEHNAGDLTAVVEAGVPLTVLQQQLSEARQMLALDPPLGQGGRATVGGVVATGDSGPLRHRYGPPRDLVVGVTVALAGGKLAKAGGKVIKNVAGYDLSKLFSGSFGTLGLIVQVALRLHPVPDRTATAAGGSTDPAALARAASELSHASLEHVALDVRWGGGDGAVLTRFGGATAVEQAEAAVRVMGLDGRVVEDDYAIWSHQREGQRSEGGTVVRVSSVQSELPGVLAAAERAGARVVGRAAAGVSWLRLEDRSDEESVAAVETLRRELAPAPCVVLDAPDGVRQSVDPWGLADNGALELMRRVRERFDPAGVCNPGVAW
jgi:glycolate oxidase FAD binding subunit